MIDRETFRELMGGVCAPVTVVTAMTADGRPFARPRRGPGSKFDGVTWAVRAGLPYLPGSAGWTAGRVERHVDGGDHVLLVVLVERATKVRPLLAGNAHLTDRERAVPAENIAALSEAGVLSVMQPARYGGLQTDFRTLLEVSREVGRACGSTA